MSPADTDLHLGRSLSGHIRHINQTRYLTKTCVFSNLTLFVDTMQKQTNKEVFRVNNSLAWNCYFINLLNAR